MRLRWPWISRRRYDAVEKEREMLGQELLLRWAEIIMLKEKVSRRQQGRCSFCHRWTGKKLHICPAPQTFQSRVSFPEQEKP